MSLTSKYSWGVDGYGYRHVYDETKYPYQVIASCKGHPVSLIEQLEEQDKKEIICARVIHQ